jgi:hypothetical protein
MLPIIINPKLSYQQNGIHYNHYIYKDLHNQI